MDGLKSVLRKITLKQNNLLLQRDMRPLIQFRRLSPLNYEVPRQINWLTIKLYSPAASPPGTFFPSPFFARDKSVSRLDLFCSNTGKEGTLVWSKLVLSIENSPNNRMCHIRLTLHFFQPIAGREKKPGLVIHFTVYTVKAKHPLSKWILYLFWETKTGVDRILVIF